MPIATKCEECGKSFEYTSPSRQRRFCSRSCVAKWGHRTGRVRPRRKTGTEVACALCGTRFYAKKHRVESGSSLFCSAVCRNGWQGRHSVVRPCEWCGREMRMSPFRATLQRFCSWTCQVEGRRKAAIDREHNGRRVTRTPAGYIMVWQPDHPASGRYGGWIQEHRLIMERELGRLLEADETVHHRNGVKDDNRPENLVVLLRGEHTKITNGEQVVRRRREREELAEYRRRYGPLPT